MRKKMVAGNWKMNGSRRGVQALANQIKEGAAALTQINILLLPSFVFLGELEKNLADSVIAWGGQNFYLGNAGAFTGEVSASMLVDYGCQYVLVGHSERRQHFHEDVNLVAAKFKAAPQFGLQPILCIGETLEQRQANQTENILKQQLASVIEAASIDAFRHAVIAYEPVWAIGTGITATPEQAQEMHAFIRGLLAQYNPDIAQKARILYGGSVKADNAADLFAMPDIDGGLVGGAALEAESFLAICQAATETCRIA